MAFWQKIFIFRRTPQQTTGFSPRATPQYIQRQLDQVQPAQHLGGFMSPAEDLPDLSQDSNAAMAPVFRNKLRGLRLTEGTDAVLQCSVVGTPKPRVSYTLGYYTKIIRANKSRSVKTNTIKIPI